MKTYLSYKNQIQGLEDVLGTVKAVEKIAASSLHFLKKEVNDLNKYFSEVELLIARLSMFYTKKEHPFLINNDSGKRAIIIMSADSGLVGGLWHNLVNVFLENKQKYEVVITIGSKGADYLNEEGIILSKSFDGSSETPLTEQIRDISEYVFGEFNKKRFSRVDILYPKFISLTEQEPIFSQFIPFKFSKEKNILENENILRSYGFPIFEPSKKNIFDWLLKKYMEIYFYKIFLETRLSELSARTITTEHASAKTSNLIDKNKSEYLKDRRALATKKQLESFVANQTL